MNSKMKMLGVFLLIGFLVSPCEATPDPRAKELDWSSKDIRVETVGDKVQIILHTGGMAGRRLKLTEIHSFGGQSETTLTWQVIQNFEESFRHMENFDVTWTMPKDEFTKLKSERKFYILNLDGVVLRRDSLIEIQSTWQHH